MDKYLRRALILRCYYLEELNKIQKKRRTHSKKRRDSNGISGFMYCYR